MARDILYSMCWEDPELVKEALKINNNDKVISITSGGENVFALLLNNPKELIAIDSNIQQIYLTQLKAAAIKELDFNEFIEFLGYKESDNRIIYFKKCRKHLSTKSIKYWENNLYYIQQGIIHCGRFENYIKKFRTLFLPLILSREQIDKYLKLNTLEQQRDFYHNIWNTIRWRLFFRVFFSKTLLQMLGRSKRFFKYNKKTSLGDYFLDKTREGVTKTPVKSNYFIQYLLTGNINTPFNNHPYLDKKNFIKLKKRVNKIKYVHSTYFEYLRKQNEKSISKHNLSDIFESMSKHQYVKCIEEIKRTTKKNGRICYWNNLVPRFNHQVKGLNKFHIKKKDRVFFYSRFIAEKKI